jgi:hypothetical protein
MRTIKNIVKVIKLMIKEAVDIISPSIKRIDEARFPWINATIV